MRAAFALRIFRGKILFYFRAPERLRTLRCSIFPKKPLPQLERKKPAARRNVLAAGSIDNWGTLIRLRC